MDITFIICQSCIMKRCKREENFDEFEEEFIFHGLHNLFGLYGRCRWILYQARVDTSRN